MRGQLSFALVFIFLAIIMAFIFAVITPMLVDFTTGMYQGAEQVFADANSIANQIQDENVRAEVANAITEAKTSTTDQINILTAFYRYGWAITILTITLVIIILARRSVEYTKGGIA